MAINRRNEKRTHRSANPPQCSPRRHLYSSKLGARAWLNISACRVMYDASQPFVSHASSGCPLRHSSTSSAYLINEDAHQRFGVASR